MAGAGGVCVCVESTGVGEHSLGSENTWQWGSYCRSDMQGTSCDVGLQSWGGSGDGQGRAVSNS